MTDANVMKDLSPLQAKKHNTVKNTLRCVLVLGVIAVVCVALLAVANRFLQVGVTLDKATATLINQIAPTGANDDEAFSKYIEMVDLGKGKYTITDLDKYNKTYGSTNQKVRALYVSTHKDTGKQTYVVEAEGKGYVDAIVMLIAYDEDNKVSGIVTKSQNESFWSHIKDFDALYAAFIGTSGTVNSGEIASSTGVTVSYTLGGMASAVSIANDFVTRLGGAVQEPYEVTDAAKLALLAKVSSSASFTCYPVGTAKVENVYIGGGDYIVEAKNMARHRYDAVTLLVRVEEGKAMQIAVVTHSFDPQEGHDSTELTKDSVLNNLFAGKTLTEINGMDPYSLAGTTGVTRSGEGLINALRNALEYEFTQEGA